MVSLFLYHHFFFLQVIIIKENELYTRKINKMPKGNYPCRLVGMQHAELIKQPRYVRTYQQLAEDFEQASALEA